MHHFEGIQWITYINEYYFDSYGFPSPKTLTIHFIKRNRKSSSSENQFEGICNSPNQGHSVNDSNCAAFCLYIFYFTKFMNMYFEPTVLPLHFDE